MAGVRAWVFAASMVAVLGCTAATAEAGVVQVPSDDAAMKAAIAKARTSLPAFWEKYAHPAANENDFALKLGITDGTNTEHFWCGNIQGTAEASTCEIANEPVYVHTVKIGQRVPVDPAIISDWMYRLDGKIRGGETIRAIIPMLSPEEAAQYKEMLADP